jgi:hypothetical protein
LLARRSCAARILDCAAHLRYRQQAGRGDGWLVGLQKIVYLLTCRVPGVAALVSRSDRAKAAGLPVLQHENAVLRRQTGRVRYEPADRVWFAALARLVPAGVPWGFKTVSRARLASLAVKPGSGH